MFFFSIKTCQEYSGVDKSFAIVKNQDFLVIFILLKSKELDDSKEVIRGIKNFINQKLPAIYEPREIILLDSQNLPLNEHG